MLTKFVARCGDIGVAGSPGKGADWDLWRGRLELSPSGESFYNIISRNITQDFQTVEPKSITTEIKKIITYISSTFSGMMLGSGHFGDQTGVKRQST